MSNDVPLTNLTRPIHFDEYTSYPPLAGGEYYYMCQGSNSRSVCCSVSRPCVHHDPDPEVRKRVHLAYMKWKHDETKAKYEYFDKVRTDALIQWAKAENEYADVLKEYGLDDSELYAQQRNP